MAAAAVNRSEIEKIVRKVLDEERPDGSAATLKAIKRVSNLLTDEVIPNLPDKNGAGNEDEPDTTDDQDSGTVSHAFAARSAGPDDGAPDEDTGSDADDENADVPSPVMQAFEALYQELSPEQATALADFFTAVSQELKTQSGETGDEDAGQDTDSDQEEGSDTEDSQRPHSRAV
jgi:hypothetical protein